MGGCTRFGVVLSTVPYFGGVQAEAKEEINTQNRCDIDRSSVRNNQGSFLVVLYVDSEAFLVVSFFVQEASFPSGTRKGLK